MTIDGSMLNVSRETTRRLDIFEQLVRKWNPRINLVSRNSLHLVRSRHFADSIQVFRAAPESKHWVDLGSGGGFPGLVVAIMAIEEMPKLQVTLIESDQRKSTFLRTVNRELGLNCQVLAERIEEVPPMQADILSARALAPLHQLIEHSERHLAKAGISLFSKGVRWQSEVAAALLRWRFQVDVIESQTMPGAAILKIQGATRV